MSMFTQYISVHSFNNSLGVRVMVFNATFFKSCKNTLSSNIHLVSLHILFPVA